MERERELPSLAAALNDRESASPGAESSEVELGERESILQRRADELDAKALSAGEKEGDLDRRSVELDERAGVLDGKESDLARREAGPRRPRRRARAEGAQATGESAGR